MPSIISDLNPWLVAVALNTVLLAIAFFAPKKVTHTRRHRSCLVFRCPNLGYFGLQGYVVVMFYFLVGSAVTRIGMEQKEAAGIAEKREGARGPENVWGSALTGSLCALGVLIFPKFAPLWLLGYVASFATKLADTCGSEVGKAYGKRTFLITTLQPVARGTEGAVSLEGTLAGVLGSIAIAIVAWSVGVIDLTGIAFCVAAAFIGTNLESVIGATLQSKFDWMTNEVVNIFNTLIGATAAVMLALIWQ
jgi:uncharacterized protein (TIGR00297 family)